MRKGILIFIAMLFITSCSGVNNLINDNDTNSTFTGVLSRIHTPHKSHI